MSDAIFSLWLRELCFLSKRSSTRGCYRERVQAVIVGNSLQSKCPQLLENIFLNTANTAPQLDITATAVRALMLYSLTEFQSGNATTIRVTADGTSFSISDDGRGHPIDKTVEGISYLKFIYTHFDYPFESGRAAPIQLQGLGMSVINALCSELTLTVRKQNETLQLRFEGGQLQQQTRTAVPSIETGITVSAKLNPKLQQHG
ncbi:MAG: hypothetical protein ACRCV9_04475, partial [Burkholderiaceae bacterium]